MTTYDLLLHVPIVEQPSADGFRATDPSFQRAIDDRLLEELERRRLDTVRLDPAQRSSWLDSAESLVRDLLASPQLPLL